MKSIKTAFPLLQRHVLCYLDTASTSQKPYHVINAMVDFYQNHNANIGRSVYPLAEEATRLYQQARRTVAEFIHASPDEVVFTSGCTESINYVADSWAVHHIGHCDEIVITQLEHHANIVPWQRVMQKTGAVVKYIPITDDGMLDVTSLDHHITTATKLVSFTLISNALGTSVDYQPIITRARSVGAKILIDASQAVAYGLVSVETMDCDFLVFSGHKMLGPTGVGVLYINKNVQPEIEPYQVGGGMVSSVSAQSATLLPSISRFEAGTPAIAQAIGLASAVTYLQQLSLPEMRTYLAGLCSLLIDGLVSIPGVRILGPIQQLKKQGHIVSFCVDQLHPHDLAAFLALKGICVRAGTHCAQPLFSRLGLPQGSVRVSFFGYNTKQDVQSLLEGLQEAISAMVFDK